MAVFITFEGCEGVGKSTQINLLKEYFISSGQKAIFTREPGGTPFAEKIRKSILGEQMSAESEALLFAAARCDHIDNLILPALKRGENVICDRYIDSSLAYQAYARGLGEKTVRELNFYAEKNCKPDAVIFLDMNPLDSFRKRLGEVIENDRMEAESDAFHLKVYEGYKILSAKDEKYIVVKPDDDMFVTASIIREALKSRGLIN